MKELLRTLISICIRFYCQKIEYSGLGVRAVRWLGNRLAIIQNTRNLTNIKPANAPQSGSGLDIGSISYEWQLSQSKAVSVSGMQVSTAPESRFLDARIFKDKDVDEIQVIGHSIAGVDLPYFSNIELCTGHKAKWIVYYWGKDEKDRMFNDLVECGISKDRINMKPALEFYDL